MEISYNVISLIDILGVVQGLLFGSMLVSVHSKKNRPTLFLGLFILLFSLEPLPSILQDLGILLQEPRLELLPVNFHFLAYPLLYIYIQKISILDNERPSYWTLIPGGLECIMGGWLFLLPVATKLRIKDSSFMAIYFLLGLCYTVYISVLILRWINKHGRELENQYAFMLSKTLNWSRMFVYASIGFHVLLFLIFFTDSSGLYLITSILNVILIYWISYQGIVQGKVLSLVGSETRTPDEPGNDGKIPLPMAELPSITPQMHQRFMAVEEVQQTLATVADYIASSKCYIKDDLTIVDLAEAIDIHPKRISHAINSELDTNFNTYINTFRIAYAKKLLKNRSTDHLSVEGIGLDAGFHSKTSFYTAFKRQVGTTPAKYRSN